MMSSSLKFDFIWLNILHLLEMLLHSTKVLPPEVRQEPKGERVGTSSCSSCQPGEQGEGGGAHGEEGGEEHQLGEGGRPVRGREQGQRPDEVVGGGQLDQEGPGEGGEGEVVGEEEEGKGEGAGPGGQGVGGEVGEEGEEESTG